ncbi:hypothetical protein AU197_11665 [Mycobacterium sp. IS-1590]|nr:hypothetical protein AU197_11665 [Mycobacterium sp. IS-1590]
MVVWSRITATEQFGGTSPAPHGHDAGRDEARFHRAAKSVALQRFSGDSLVRNPEVSKCELLAEEPIRIGLGDVARTNIVNCTPDNFFVVIDQASGRMDGHEPSGVCESLASRLTAAEGASADLDGVIEPRACTRSG